PGCARSIAPAGHGHAGARRPRLVRGGGPAGRGRGEQAHRGVRHRRARADRGAGGVGLPGRAPGVPDDGTRAAQRLAALMKTMAGPEAHREPAVARPRDAGGPPRLVLKKNQDRRVRAGHPWIFSNEVAELLGSPADGDLVDVLDFRGAFLGRAYYNHTSLICARILTRGHDAIDVEFLVKRIERAAGLREQVLPGERAVRVVYGEADQLPGLVVDRYGDWLAVQILTLGMETRAEEIRAALERTLAPRGAVKVCDTPLRELEGLPLERVA